MSSYTAVIERWLAIERGERPGKGGYLSNWRMPCGRGAIYSYGHHFPLAETIRDSKGRIRLFVLNGDRSSMTTMTKHQPAIRAVLQASGIPCMVVPFSALEASGIRDRWGRNMNIRPIDIRPDRVERWRESVPGDYSAIQWSGVRSEDIYKTYPRYDEAPVENVGAIHENGTIPGNPDGTASRCWRGYDYKNGGFLDYDKPLERIYHQGSSVEWSDEHGWSVERYRHWLGDSVFRAKVGNGWRTFVSSFDYQESAPLYFLAELPRGVKVSTVEDAILALSPRIVHAAIAQGREVKRQGDMFAIPTELSTIELKRRGGRNIERMVGVFGTDHVVTERITGRGGATYARGVIHHRPGGTPDHRRVRLGNQWHLMVPNTVPRRRAGAMVRVAR